MDPVTAALQAFNTFNQVLLTPPGQILMVNSEKVVADLLDKFNVHLATGPAVTTK